jgi:GWxTD domain-containing protein
VHGNRGATRARSLRVVWLGGALLASAACRAPAPAAQTARSWAAGPVRWLLLPDELEELREVRTSAQFSGFLQAFWTRRDDDRSDDEIPFGAVFAERVAAADRLYVEDGLRGSLTDRGGALVLLGPPTILRSSQRRTPTWTGDPPPGARPTKLVQLETWAWQGRDLSPELRTAFGLADDDQEVTLTFVVGSRHTRLLDGREVLALAACAAARCADEDG